MQLMNPTVAGWGERAIRIENNLLALAVDWWRQD
jgi:hypothetical protein